LRKFSLTGLVQVAFLFGSLLTPTHFVSAQTPATNSWSWSAEYFPLQEKKKEEAKPLFVQTTEIKESGDELDWSAILKDQEQKVVMTEKVKMKGVQVTEHMIEQLQINEAYQLIYRDNQIEFKTFQIKNPSAEKFEEKYKLLEEKKVSMKDEFLMGPSTHRFFQRDFEKLTKGESIKRDFGIFELQRLISFQFKILEEKEAELVIEMKPKNMFVSMLVSPMKMILDKQSKRIIRYYGRTPVRTFEDGKWKPFDSEIHYKYSTP
jgi:hypothetical protein